MRGEGPAVPARAHLVPARGCGSAPARGERPRPRVTNGPIRVPAGGAAQAAPGAGAGPGFIPQCRTAPGKRPAGTSRG